MTVLNELREKRQLVKTTNEILFGGGGSKTATGDNLNWAFQQIRETGKPAGDVEKYNEAAAEMLMRLVPGYEPEEAGQLVQEIHGLYHQYELEVQAELVGRGIPERDQPRIIREATSNLITVNEAIKIIEQ